MSWWQVRFAVPAEMAEAAAWLLAERLDVPVEVQGDDTMLKAGPEGWSVVVGLPQAPPHDIEAQITGCLGQLGLPPAAVHTRRSDDESWREGWRAFFRGGPLSPRVGVHPPWEDPPPRPVAVCIEPGMAFGTGTHETTRAVMDLLDETLGDRPPLSVLDVGTGSAILAIAAARLGHRVVGVDTDAVALENAAENVARNGVADRVKLRVGSADAVDTRYPLVVANILARILVRIAPAVMARCAPGGELILSGMLTHQVDAVLEAHPGFVERARRVVGPWVAVVLKAPA